MFYPHTNACWTLQIINNMFLSALVSNWVPETPDHLKTQEICAEAVHIEPYPLKVVLDRFKNQVMRDKAVKRELHKLE